VCETGIGTAEAVAAVGSVETVAGEGVAVWGRDNKTAAADFEAEAVLVPEAAAGGGTVCIAEEEAAVDSAPAAVLDPAAPVPAAAGTVAGSERQGTGSSLAEVAAGTAVPVPEVAVRVGIATVVVAAATAVAEGRQLQDEHEHEADHKKQSQGGAWLLYCCPETEERIGESEISLCPWAFSSSLLLLLLLRSLPSSCLSAGVSTPAPSHRQRTLASHFLQATAMERRSEKGRGGEGHLLVVEIGGIGGSATVLEDGRQ
jgi:hypothetical protein